MVVAGLLLSFCCYCCYYYYSQCRRLKKHVITSLVTLPRYPLIGNVLSLLPDVFLDELYRLKLQHGPLIELFNFQRRILLISDILVVKDLLRRRPKVFRRGRTLDYFAFATTFDLSLFFAHGDTWSLARKITSPSFNKQNTDSYASDCVSCLTWWLERLGRLAAGQDPTGSNPTNPSNGKQTVIDFRSETFRYTIRNIATIAFALEDNVDNYFYSGDFVHDLQIMFDFGVQSMLFPLPMWFWKYSPMYALEVKAKEANKRLDQACMEVINDRRQKRANGITVSQGALIDILLKHEEKDLKREDLDRFLIHNIKVFFVAGAETSSTALVFFAFQATKNPVMVEKVRAESDSFYNKFGDISKARNLSSSSDVCGENPYTMAVVKELVRLYHPTAVLMFATESQSEPAVLANGIVVNPQDEIFLHVDGVLLDPENFENPLEFQPERWLTDDKNRLAAMENCFIGFGFGPRICPGMNLAYLEAVVAILGLIRTFDFTLACPENEIKRVLNFTTAPNKLPIYLTKRK